MSNVDLSPVRSQFPALALRDAGRPAVYFDGPGGTQVPQCVVDAMGRYLIQANANHGGAFRTSRESDAILAAAHEAMADMLNAPSTQEIVFGANMTTLTFAFSRAIGRELVAGRRDHHHATGSRRRPGALAGAGRAWRDHPRDRLCPDRLHAAAG